MLDLRGGRVRDVLIIFVHSPFPVPLEGALPRGYGAFSVFEAVEIFALIVTILLLTIVLAHPVHKVVVELPAVGISVLPFHFAVPFDEPLVHFALEGGAIRIEVLAISMFEALPERTSIFLPIFMMLSACPMRNPISYETLVTGTIRQLNNSFFRLNLPRRQYRKLGGLHQLVRMRGLGAGLREAAAGGIVSVRSTT